MGIDYCKKAVKVVPVLILVALLFAFYYGWAWMDTQEIMNEVVAVSMHGAKGDCVTSSQKKLAKVFAPNREGLDGSSISTVDVRRTSVWVLGSLGRITIAATNEITEEDGSKSRYQISVTLLLEKGHDEKWQISEVRTEH